MISFVPARSIPCYQKMIWECWHLFKFQMNLSFNNTYVSNELFESFLLSSRNNNRGDASIFSIIYIRLEREV
jgi:hypothetical protein